MVNKNIAIIGGSSEIAIEFKKLCIDQDINCLVFSRNLNDNSNFIKINDYIKESDEIIKNLINLKNLTIIFFNGALYENRPIKFPTEKEIALTKLINYEIPIQLTKKINKELKNIEKYVYISSMAAIKFREKNYIYGSFKKKLEIDIKSLNLPANLIFRFGKVFTRMSEGHKTPPFSMTSFQAANAILKNLNKENIQYGNFGLSIVAFLVKVTPTKVINFLKI